MKKLLFIFFCIYLIFTNTALAQLSQLEFDDEKVEAKPVDEKSLKEITSDDKLPKTAAEAEEMERAAIDKLKNPTSSSSQASSSAQASSAQEKSEEEVKKFDYFGGVVPVSMQHGCASIPPRLKGPFVDAANESSITSKSSWPIPKNKDCTSLVDDKSFLAKALAIREILYRFSGNTDYTDLAASQICAKHCNTEPLVSDMRIEGANFAVAVAENACRLILDKPKEKPWKMLKVQSLVCSCFDPSKAKAAIEAQVLETK